MNLLAVDTAGRTCSAALVIDGRTRAEFFADFDQTHARHLMKLIDSAMKLAGTQIADMDGFGVNVGPGSFTGLRIGLSTIKGFALASGKPVAGITAFSALAHPVTIDAGLLCPAIDARKGEVYAEVYRVGQSERIPILPAQASPPEALADRIRQLAEPCCFVGSGAVLYQDLLTRKLGAQARFASGAANQIRAGIVGELAYLDINRGKAQSGSDLVPYYIRSSDAERQSSARTATQAAK